LVCSALVANKRTHNDFSAKPTSATDFTLYRVKRRGCKM